MVSFALYGGSMTFFIFANGSNLGVMSRSKEAGWNAGFFMG
jgi:hypothetical protein